MSYRGYNVFWPVHQSVRQFCLFCQSNSSETAQENFTKLCSNEEILHRCAKLQQIQFNWFNFFLGIMLLLNLDIEIWPKLNILLKMSAKLLWNHSTEFHVILKLHVKWTYCLHVHIHREFWFDFFLLRRLAKIYYFVQHVLNLFSMCTWI